jgi:tRNA wybutosine-synthesizing protein 3
MPSWACISPCADAKQTKDALVSCSLLDRSRLSLLLDSSVALPCLPPPLNLPPLLSGLVFRQDLDLQPSSRRTISPASVLRASVSQLLLAHGAPQELLCDLPTRWERLGDMVLLAPASLADARWALLPAEQLWAAVAAALGARRLARQARVDPGELRKSRATVLHPPGCSDGWTEQKENGVVYCLDATQSMFSSGNGTEKQRIASLSCRNETVVDLFAGIGYWTLPLLVHARAAHVYACELNPYSVAALTRGLELNGVPTSACTVLPGDCRATAPSRCADRVLLGLLPDARLGYATALRALKPSGGLCHVHGLCPAGGQAAWGEAVAAELAALARSTVEQSNLEKAGPAWAARCTHVEVVKSYAPRILHTVADVHLFVPSQPCRLLTAHSGARGSQTAILALQCPTPEALHSAAVSVGAPCHLLSLAQSSVKGLTWWQFWSAERLLSAGGETLYRRVAVHESDSPCLDWHPAKSFTLQTVAFSELLTQASCPKHRYLRSVADDARAHRACFSRDWPELSAAFSAALPACCAPPPPRELHSSVLRAASPGLSLWLHYDALDNVLVQLSGRKRLLLFPPYAAGGLYLQGSSSRIPTAMLNDPASAAEAGFVRYPDAHSHALSLQLGPGEGVFIPAFWAHAVVAEADDEKLSFALNFFWADDAAPSAGGVYGNEDPPAAVRAQRAVDEGVGALLALPPGARAFFAARLAAQLQDV